MTGITFAAWMVQRSATWSCHITLHIYSTISFHIIIHNYIYVSYHRVISCHHNVIIENHRNSFGSLRCAAKDASVISKSIVQRGWQSLDQDIWYIIMGPFWVHGIWWTHLKTEETQLDGYWGVTYMMFNVLERKQLAKLRICSSFLYLKMKSHYSQFSRGMCFKMWIVWSTS